MSATKTRNYLKGDPLLDWLDLYGREHGFVPEHELPTYDRRTDMRELVFDLGARFEAGVVTLIRDHLRAVRIAEVPADSRDPAKAQTTLDAMREGVPVIEQAVLVNEANQTYGIADLLVRSDQLNELVPDTLDDEEAGLPAPGLAAEGSAPPPWHYRVLDIKFKTLDLRKDGSAGSALSHYMAQVWTYNEALSQVLGMTPGASYLLGRSWHQGKGRGDSCFERLARVDHVRHISKDAETLSAATGAAVEWIRRVRREGAQWQVLPTPSVPELYPHMRHTQDQPWGTAKQRIGAELAELTLLPRMNPTLRRDAHAQGITAWTDPRASSTSLHIGADEAKCDAVLRANRDQPELVVVPERLTVADPAWRDPARLEFFVDFETVNNLRDDFTALPRVGGQPLIFQVGCGWLDGGAWRFSQGTVRRLTEPDEAAMIDGWLEAMQAQLTERGLTWADARLYHWSPAETASMDSSYNSARERHPERRWPDLPWFDLLQRVVRAEPMAVRGAFNFGLKPIATGMHRAGLIKTLWADSAMDGLGAMVGAWWCDDQASQTGVTLSDVDLMAEIAAYNQVDCRSMAEILAWLRENR